MSYARYLAKNGLPTSLAEREAAGYRSAWPPLYHFMVAGPLKVVGDTPPTRLKAVGDSPRRLIPTNGQTIAAYVHTADEAWPWQGLPLAWHLGRLISVTLATLSVLISYVIAWRLTARPRLALSAAALQATLPQFLFVSSVISDDNLLIFFSGLILLTLVRYTQGAAFPGIGQAFFLGLLLGLATVAKYNALPLWGLTVIWGGWLVYKKAPAPLPDALTRLTGLLVGAFLTGGWWFVFVWRAFNQLPSQGLLAGSLAALTAGTADASLRQLSQGLSLSLPLPERWLAWFITLFKSFWGLFGGGGTIELPGWIYGLLALICLAAAIAYLLPVIPSRRPTPKASRLTASASLFLLATPLFFLPLPLFRFILTGGNIVETAQGRHLFPALPAITLGLVWGLSYLFPTLRRRTPSPASRPAPPVGSFILPVLTAILSLYSLILIQTSYPPLIPLRTTPETAFVQNRVRARLGEGITLIGYTLGRPENQILPLTLVWQAGAIPAQDYLIEVTLTAAGGQPSGGWIGQPLGGRYPTRAWDPGDLLSDTIPIPLLATQPATLTVRLLDSSGSPTPADPLILASGIDLPAASQALTPLFPPQLRADGLAPEAPFTYRSTLSFRLPQSRTAPELIAPDGRRLPPDRFLPGDRDSIAHFLIKASWPAGQYELSANDYQLTVENRLRQFEPPPMARPVNATFAHRITLLGYDLPRQRVQPGEAFPVTIHMRAEQTMGQNLVLFNHLLDSEAVQRGGADRIPQKYYTTLLWVPGEIVSDSYEVPVDPDAPPGVYWLDVGFYPSNQPSFSLPLTANGQPIEQNSVRLGPIKVGGPPPGLTTAAAQPQHRLAISFDDQITLLGFDLTGMNSHPKLTLYWQPTAVPEADYTVFIHLLGSTGQLIAQADSPPAGGAYPTSLWAPGETIIDEHQLSQLPPGSYTLQVGLYHPGTGARLPATGAPDGSVRLLSFEVQK